MVKFQTPLSLSMLAGPAGTSVREVCPKCLGGSDSERCISIQCDTDGSISWKCFRAQCGYSGGRRTAQPGAKAKEPRNYTRPYKALTDDQALVIATRFGLPSDSVDGYSDIDDRFILGVSGPQHQARGHIAYSLSGGKPKSLTYNAMPDEPFIHWAMSFYPLAIVVVEDFFSSEKVREANSTGVSIMGTNLTQQMVTEIGIVADRWQCPVYIALDRDAFSKAVGYVNRYKEQFRYGLQVMALVRDLKYELTETIKHAITTGTVDFSLINRK